MAAGTLVSRVTGFARTTILVAALGTTALADTYNTANTIPNIVYDIFLGGVLTAVHVPLLMRARERSSRYGEEFEHRLLTLAVLLLTALTLVAMVAAPLLIGAYAHGFTPAQRKLGIIFLLFFLPQVFFYGLSALLTASLNSRSRFGAPMWAPVLNNVVVCAVGIAFIALSSGRVSVDDLSVPEIVLLGLGTTAGVVLQCLSLIPSLRGAGFRWRMRFDFQPGELGAMGSLAGWTLVLVAAQQLALLVYTNISNAAGAQGLQEGVGYGVGLTPWMNAYQFFQLPFGIVAVSVITALFPAMSRNASAGRLDLVSDDLGRGLRLALVGIVPAVAIFLGDGRKICVVFFAHGATTVADATMIARVLFVFALGLIPFVMFQLLQRGIFALNDTRTPALVGIGATGAGVLVAVLVFELLPVSQVILGVAAAQVVAWSVAAGALRALLARRVDRDAGRLPLGHIARLGIASSCFLLTALASTWLVPQAYSSSRLELFFLLVADTAVGGLGFLWLAKALRVDEIERLRLLVMSRLGSGSQARG